MVYLSGSSTPVRLASIMPSIIFASQKAFEHNAGVIARHMRSKSSRGIDISSQEMEAESTRSLRRTARMKTLKSGETAGEMLVCL